MFQEKLILKNLTVQFSYMFMQLIVIFNNMWTFKFKAQQTS